MDLTNFDEVTRAIREENWNMGVNLNNLDASVSDYANKGADSYWADCMREVVEKAALEMLYLIKMCKREKAYEKSDELFRKYQAISEEDVDANSEAFEAYKDAGDEACDLDAEGEEIKAHFNAQDYHKFME